MPEALTVSIHAPWEGCDFHNQELERIQKKFQFTHPGKGATVAYAFYLAMKGVSIHAPWEGCDAIIDFCSIINKFVSIHAPWEGCDSGGCSPLRGPHTFQFTHPGKGATLWAVHRGSECWFQFTHPGKGATLRAREQRVSVEVSIHAPWEGCDQSVAFYGLTYLCFNSRTLGRVRRLIYSTLLYPSVSIHAPWEGCDANRVIEVVRGIEFQFTHPGKGATQLVDN